MTLTSLLVCSACSKMPNCGGSADPPVPEPKIVLPVICGPTRPPTRPCADSRDSGLSERRLPACRPPHHQTAQTRNRAVIRQTQITGFGNADFHHHRFDEDLATRHIQTTNHIAQRQEVFARRQDYKRVGRFVRRHFHFVLNAPELPCAPPLDCGGGLKPRPERPRLAPADTEMPSPPSTCTMSSALAFSSA